MADAAAETTPPRYAIAVGPTGLHRIVARDGRPLGAPRPAGSGPPAAGLLIALRWRQAIRAAHTVPAAVTVGAARRAPAPSASFEAPSGQRRAGAPVACPPDAAVRRLGPAAARRGRPPGWRPADRGAFARRLAVDGAAVREARQRAGLSQRTLARQLGLVRSVVAMAELGGRSVCPALARWAAQVLGRRRPGPVELRRAQVLGRVLSGEWTTAAAAAALGRSPRQVRRLAQAYGAWGPAGLVHGNRGRAPANRLPATVRARAVELGRTTYAKCTGVELAARLAEREGIAVSRVTLLRWRRSA